MRVLVVDENCKWCKGNGKKHNGQPCGHCLRAAEIEAVKVVEYEETMVDGGFRNDEIVTYEIQEKRGE